jgi:hypothetical protein
MTISLLLGFLFASNFLATPALAADVIAPQLRAQVEKSRPNLGELPAWQEEIFQNEVVPSSGRFIRDYKTAGGRLIKADVDFDGIKKYLSFTATQILKPDAMKMMLFVRTNAACTDCAKAAAAVRIDLKERLERRGLEVIIPTSEEMKHSPTDVYSHRNAGGWLVAEIRAEEDPDHAGDMRYGLMLDFHFPGTLASSVQKQMEILPSDSIEVSMSRLAIDAITELGRKARQGYAAAAVESSGVELSLEGVGSFPVIAQIKSRLRAALGNDYRVVEKLLQRNGPTVLVVLAGATGEENANSIASELRKIPFEGFTVKVTNVGDGKVQARVVTTGVKGAA